MTDWPLTVPRMDELPLSSHIDSVGMAIELKGSAVADVGCGFGELALDLIKMGANSVVGVECSLASLTVLSELSAPANCRFTSGTGEDLPLETESLDLVIYLNSFHHVPVLKMKRAIDETLRALRPEGHLLVNEPIPLGPYFSITREIEDETEIRRAALIELLSNSSIQLERKNFYKTTKQFSNFEDFITRSLAIRSDRGASIDAKRARLRTVFESLGQRSDRGFRFEQPMSSLLFRKA